MKALVLLSGGIDSAVTLSQALADGSEETMAVSFRYGSKHGEREIEAAKKIVWYYYHQSIPIRHKVIDLPRIFEGGQSAVMGDIEMPLEEYKNYESGEGESVTVVPFRNANLISGAVTIAEVYRFDKVYAGMHATDHSTWAYPDCTPEFLGAMANAIYVGTLGRVRLVFPLVWMTKDQVIRKAVDLDTPAHLTWSCYLGGEVACGQCPTCLERLKAFIQAGFRDPIKYAVGTNVGDSFPLAELPLVSGWKYDK